MTRPQAPLLLAIACCVVAATSTYAQEVSTAATDAAKPPVVTTSTAEGAITPGDAKPKLRTLLVNERQLRVSVPATWEVVEPRNRLIEFELAILPDDAAEPAEDPGSDAAALAPRGRLTMMAAGGDIDSNIRRWVGQFRLGRDADGKDAMQRDERKLRGAVAHVLDIAGTYFDSPKGPFGPKVELADYRMLGAIIEVEGAGKYFVKFYGPSAIVEANREAFEAMLASLEVVEPARKEAAPGNNLEEQPTAQAEVGS